MYFITKEGCTKNDKLCWYFRDMGQKAKRYVIISDDTIPCAFCNRATPIPVKDYHNFSMDSE